MKKIKIGYIFLAILSFAIGSCVDEELATLNPAVTVQPVASDSDVVLTKELEGTDVLSISWPKPDFGFSAAPTYLIYLDKEDGDFSEPIIINNAGSLQKTLKSEELNRHLIALGFEPGVPGTLKVKVEAKLGTFKSITSEVISVTATAYTSFLDLSTSWGVVGSGYNNWGAFPDAPFFTTKTANVLVAYVKLINGAIKFRENNDWANNLGDSGGDGTLESNGADIPVTAGNYKITFNTQTKTYSIEKYSWGIVGSAYNDWGSAGPDFNFTYDDATDQWRAIVKLKDGAFKIRKNNDWGLNYGDTGANGTLEEGGADMIATAGKYQITFNETEKTIEIEPIEHIWGLVGSAYNDWGNGGPDAQFDRDWRNDGVWILRNVPLLAGAFKIRDDNSWAINYGDTGADGTLELGGTDIVSTAGIHTITLDFSDPDSPTWTSVKY
jgi:starch-binding outer membrane protein SusE/F